MYKPVAQKTDNTDLFFSSSPLLLFQSLSLHSLSISVLFKHALQASQLKNDTPTLTLATCYIKHVKQKHTSA